MRTPRLPVVDWIDAPTDLNGLVSFVERRNLFSARVPSYCISNAVYSRVWSLLYRLYWYQWRNELWFITHHLSQLTCSIRPWVFVIILRKILYQLPFITSQRSVFSCRIRWFVYSVHNIRHLFVMFTIKWIFFTKQISIINSLSSGYWECSKINHAETQRSWKTLAGNLNHAREDLIVAPLLGYRESPSRQFLTCLGRASARLQRHR
jgi:hypothetical protein